MATYVIVGGVAGGATAAARLRRMDESAEIIVLERGEYVSFANCGLPYHIGGVIAQRDALLVSTPDKLCAEFAIDVRTEHEVLRIDREAHEVEVREVRTAAFTASPMIGSSFRRAPNPSCRASGRRPAGRSYAALHARHGRHQGAPGRRVRSAVVVGAGSSGSRWPRTCASAASTSPSSRCCPR